MNVTFLIGNGFDLACGMKTRYSDVYERYIKTPSATPIIEQFKDDLIKEKTKENLAKAYRYLIGKGFSYEEASFALSQFNGDN